MAHHPVVLRYERVLVSIKRSIDRFMKWRWFFHAVIVVPLALTCSSCGEKKAPPPVAPRPTPVTIESSENATPAEPSPAPPAPVASADSQAEAPEKAPATEDPVSVLQKREMDEMNQGLKAFIAKYQRMPKDFAEFALNIPGVPGPPMGKYWVLDAETKSVKLKSR